MGFRASNNGMKQGSFVQHEFGATYVDFECCLSPLQNSLVSEAAACDGILYRVGPEDDNTNPGPGILPI